MKNVSHPTTHNQHPLLTCLPLTTFATFATFAVIAALTLSACGGKSSDGSAGGTNEDSKAGVTPKTKVVTNTTSCGSGQAPTSAVGSWETDLQLDQNKVHFDFAVVLTIDQNYVTITNNCTINGQQLTSTTGAAAEITDDTITILEDAAHTENAGDESSHLSCTASIKKGEVRYRASGSCLAMTGLNGGETLTMIPARQGHSSSNSSGGISQNPPSGFPPPQRYPSSSSDESNDSIGFSSSPI